MELKEGDRVLIKDIFWYDKNKNRHGSVAIDGALFYPIDANYLNRVVSVKTFITGSKYFNEATECLPVFCIDRVLPRIEEPVMSPEHSVDSRPCNQFISNTDIMKLQLKEGDKVLIKSREWYEKNKNKQGDVHFKNEVFTLAMTEHLGKIVTFARGITGRDVFSLGLYQEWLPYFCIERILTKEEAIAGHQPKPAQVERPLKNIPKEMMDVVGNKLADPLFKNSGFSSEEFRMAIENHPASILRKDTSDLDSFTVRNVMLPGILVTKSIPYFALFSPEKEPLPPTEEYKLIKRNKFLKLDV